MKDTYESPLNSRYASDRMKYIFSPDFKFRTWRRLWIALAESEKELGLNITDEQIAELKAHKDDINYDVAAAREKEVRHDVMSHVYAYGVQCPNAKPIIHLGATSCYVGDNTDVIIMREAMLLIRKELVNLLNVLDGKIINEAGYLVDRVSGEVSIALPQQNENLLFSGKDSIVICGDQAAMARRAMEMNVNCLIVCQAELPAELRAMQTTTCILATPFDAFKAARMIYHAIEAGRICRTEELDAFHLTDFVDDVKDVMLESRHRSYPILDENDKVVGTISRYHLLKPRRKRVVLVDHNEMSQSVPGLEQADILEIIDHHRLADIQTGAPIYFRNEPVGSTATIIASMYQERGLLPSDRLAGLMAAAIVADTVMFKSPTSTQRDQRMAERMARIANISLDELGQVIFSASMDSKPTESLLFGDFKDFHIADHDFGVSQITCIDSKRMMERKDEFLALMQKTMEERGYTLMILMLTDVLLEGTQILYIGDEEIFSHAFNTPLKDHTCFLSGVVSRKKQIIPMLSALWG